MPRSLLLFAALALVALPAAAQSCDLQIAVTCTPGSNNSSNCTSVTTNGNSSCSGFVFLGFAGGPGAQFSGFSNSLGLTECFDSSFLGAEAGDQPFVLCFSPGSIAAGARVTSSVTVTGSSGGLLAFTGVFDEETGEDRGFVFAEANVSLPTCTPDISSPPLTQSGFEYTVSWTRISDPSAQYVIEESTSPDFTSNVTQTQVNGLSRTFRHDASTSTTYYYRVRATNCVGGTPSFSGTTSTVVQAPAPATSRNPEATVPFGSTQPVSIQVFIPGGGAAAKTALGTGTFTASTDKPYLTVTPSQGPLPPGGTTVTVTASPTGQPPGASTGTLKVTANGNRTTNTPVSINLATAVGPGGKTTPPPNALIIPVVTHVNGVAGPFLSDVRLTNATNSPVKYQVTMTPTQTDGTKSSKVTAVTVGSQETSALNDIVKNFFGFGATGALSDIGFGSLEIRPIDSGSLQTFASSRTYASTARGTFGQFVGAVPFGQFATKRAAIGLPIGGGSRPITKLSLQQVAQSARFRTNFGIAEGAGEPASGVIRIFNAAGARLNEVPFSLMPGEQRQFNAFIAANGVPTLEDGRLEVEITSETGAVTAYASVLDNVTTDPLAVAPVNVEAISSSRYVLPGVAELNNGASNFHSDIRIFNGGSADVVANLTYYPGAVAAQPMVIRAGEMKVLDNALPSFFNLSSGAGFVVVTTPQASSLVTSARTYTTVENNGSYGQFIPGLTPPEGLGRGERALQVLQLEQSDQFRSNVGFVELTGNPVTLKVSMHMPDTKATPSITVPLAGNEFRQLGRIIEGFLGTGSQTYNARVTVEVTEGSGRVAAYASIIDNESLDPTYVPSQ
jgi:hypothetical protein